MVRRQRHEGTHGLGVKGDEVRETVIKRMPHVSATDAGVTGVLEAELVDCEISVVH